MQTIHGELQLSGIMSTDLPDQIDCQRWRITMGDQ
jgi:hypothetical protein